MQVVAISRQFGSGGNTVARLVAGRLGYKLIDQDVAKEVARLAGLSPSHVSDAERVFGDALLDFFHEVFYRSPGIRHLPGIKHDLDESRYRQFLTTAIQELAGEQPSIIVTGAAALVLADDPECVRVALVARDEDRVARLREHYQLDQAKAEQVARTEEHKRLKVLLDFGRGDPCAAQLYHLTLNTSLVSYEEAADLICRLAERRRGAAGAA